MGMTPSQHQHIDVAFSQTMVMIGRIWDLIADWQARGRERYLSYRLSRRPHSISSIPLLSRPVKGQRIALPNGPMFGNLPWRMNQTKILKDPTQIVQTRLL